MLFAYHLHTTSYVMVFGLLETIFFILKVFRKKDVKLHWLFSECHMVVAVCYPMMTKWMNKVSLPNQYQIFQPTLTCWLSLIHYSNVIISVLTAKGKKTPCWWPQLPCIKWQTIWQTIWLRAFIYQMYWWHKLIWQHWLSNLILPFYEVVSKIIIC